MAERALPWHVRALSELALFSVYLSRDGKNQKQEERTKAGNRGLEKARNPQGEEECLCTV